MQNFMKTILSAVKTWTKGKIKDSTADWNQSDSSADNYVKNRTHYDSRKTEEVNIAFDSVLDGKEYLDLNGDGSFYAVKVSDLTPSIEEVVGGTFSVVDGEVVDTIKVTADLVQQNSDTLYGIDDGGIMVALEDMDMGNGFVLAKGTWFLMGVEGEFVWYYSDLSYSKESGELKKLDSKYLDLPTNIATTDDVQEALDYAQEAYEAANTANNAANMANNAAAAAQSTADSKMDKVNPVGTGSFSMNSAAYGSFSSAEGQNTIAKYRSQKTYGEFNIKDSPKYWLEEISKSLLIDPNKNYPVYTDLTFNEDSGVISLLNSSGTAAPGSAPMLGKYIYEKDVYRISGYSNYDEYTGVFRVDSYKSSSITIVSCNVVYFKATRQSSTDRGTYVHIVGNGTSDTARSNAHTLDWEGNAWYQGDVYIGSTSGTNKDEGSKKLATEEYVNEQLSQINVEGGSSVSNLVVTLTDGVASSTSTEIYAHVQNGGAALLLYNDQYFVLEYCKQDMASFVHTNTEEQLMTQIDIYDDGSFDEYVDVSFSAARYGTLTVTITNDVASSTSAEIIDHVQNGGNALLQYGNNEAWTLGYYDSNVYFIKEDLEDAVFTTIVIYADGSVEKVEQAVVPTSRKVNGKALSTNITLSAEDVGALPDTTVIPTVPTNVSAFTNDAGYLTQHQDLSAYAKTADLGDLATKDTVAKTDLASDVQASLGKADSALQSYTETDPTVPAWAKAANKPSYTASEITVDTSSWNIGGGDEPAEDGGDAVLSDILECIDNDVTALHLNVASLNAEKIGAVPTSRKVNGKMLNTNITLSASDVGADASGTASTAVAAHNTATDSHSDIREQIAAVDAKIVSEIAVMTKSEYNNMTQSDLSALYAQGVRMIAVTENSYTNLVPLSIDTNGNVYNGTGYMDGYRLNSSGAVVAAEGCTHTGYIPYVADSVIRSKGSTAGSASAAGQYITFYDSNFTLVALESLGTATSGDRANGTYVTGDDGYDIFTFDCYTVQDTQETAFAYFRISHASCNGNNLIITINEEI